MSVSIVPLVPGSGLSEDLREDGVGQLTLAKVSYHELASVAESRLDAVFMAMTPLTPVWSSVTRVSGGPCKFSTRR